MTLFLTVVFCVVGVLAATLLVLARVWSHTPHGRLKPIFALAFRLMPLLDRAGADRAIGATDMSTAEKRAAARRRFLESTASLAAPEPFAGSIEGRSLASGPSGEVGVRIYRAQNEAPLPLILYAHGGGFVVGSPDYTDVVCRILAHATPAVVVSVDYRLAPEHPAPAAADDCAFVLDWCTENAATIGARSGGFVVAGDSAGGNLAAVLAQRERDGGRNRIALQVLIYPTVDVSRQDRPSQLAFARGYGLSLLDVEDCMRNYVPADMQRSDPRVSPLHAPSLAGLPPAYVLTAGFDLLRDEGRAYAEALAEAGVDVVHTEEASLPHGVITMTRICRESRDSLEKIAKAIGEKTTAA